MNKALPRALRDITLRIAWFPVVVFSAHVLSSKVLGLYEVIPDLDVPMHFAGGVAIAYFFRGVMEILAREGLVQRAVGALEVVCVFALTGTATAFWEFAEYASDHTIGTHAQGGLEDTLFDMLLGLTGGSVYLLVRWVRAMPAPSVLPPAAAPSHSELLDAGDRSSTDARTEL